MIEIKVHKKLKGAAGDMDLKFDCQWSEGCLTAIYGPSGVGKSSLLRMLAGLMKPDSGRIKIGEKVWFDSEKKIDLKPQERNVGLVFQDASLFPNMTVEQNLHFALKRDQSSEIVDSMLDVAGLQALRQSKPSQLSGGQSQRVAVARALIRKPSLLLLDEPLSALDLKIRETLQDFIVDFHKKFDLSTILVSHQFSEVLRMSDHIVTMEDGQVSNEGKAVEIFDVSNTTDDPMIEVDIISRNGNELTVLVNSKLYQVNVSPNTVIQDGKVKLPLSGLG